MACIIENSIGTITIKSEVVARIAGMAATSCYGIVGMAAKSVRDGFVRLLKRENLSRGVKIKFLGGLLHVNLHVIAEYGTNIAAICESAVSNVKYTIEDMIGVKIGTVNIFVEGLRVDK
jgi:uncharacterized alkaline shock family protein YloU